MSTEDLFEYFASKKGEIDAMQLNIAVKGYSWLEIMSKSGVKMNIGIGSEDEIFWARKLLEGFESD
jgi:hypothetical protein